jgi:hypothetical protein
MQTFMVLTNPKTANPRKMRGFVSSERIIYLTPFPPSIQINGIG